MGQNVYFVVVSEMKPAHILLTNVFNVSIIKAPQRSLPLGGQAIDL